MCRSRPSQRRNATIVPHDLTIVPMPDALQPPQPCPTSEHLYRASWDESAQQQVAGDKHTSKPILKRCTFWTSRQATHIWRGALKCSDIRQRTPIADYEFKVKIWSEGLLSALLGTSASSKCWLTRVCLDESCVVVWWRVAYTVINNYFLDDARLK